MRAATSDRGRDVRPVRRPPGAPTRRTLARRAGGGASNAESVRHSDARHSQDQRSGGLAAGDGDRRE